MASTSASTNLFPNFPPEIAERIFCDLLRSCDLATCFRLRTVSRRFKILVDRWLRVQRKLYISIYTTVPSLITLTIDTHEILISDTRRSNFALRHVHQKCSAYMKHLLTQLTGLEQLTIQLDATDAAYGAYGTGAYEGGGANEATDKNVASVIQAFAAGTASVASNHALLAPDGSPLSLHVDILLNVECGVGLIEVTEDSLGPFLNKMRRSLTSLRVVEGAERRKPRLLRDWPRLYTHCRAIEIENVYMRSPQDWNSIMMMNSLRELKISGDSWPGNPRVSLCNFLNVARSLNAEKLAITLLDIGETCTLNQMASPDSALRKLWYLRTDARVNYSQPVDGTIFFLSFPNVTELHLHDKDNDEPFIKCVTMMALGFIRFVGTENNGRDVPPHLIIRSSLSLPQLADYIRVESPRDDLNRQQDPEGRSLTLRGHGQQGTVQFFAVVYRTVYYLEHS